jgi:hypothetical protein
VVDCPGSFINPAYIGVNGKSSVDEHSPVAPAPLTPLSIGPHQQQLNAAQARTKIAMRTTIVRTDGQVVAARGHELARLIMSDSR